MTQAAVIATMPLTSQQARHFNEEEMPLNKFQHAIGDGLIKLAGEQPEKSDE
ncbi:hypothetical protein PMI07_002062 [Rhizobium sp. CF080]|nr:hypothetical protein PMI07_002062 [Rhizobium sp. CF080]